MQDVPRVITATVFVGVSLDGFLARPNDDIDWLTGSGEPGDFGYDELIAGIDAIVMGRRTSNGISRPRLMSWPRKKRSCAD